MYYYHVTDHLRLLDIDRYIFRPRRYGITSFQREIGHRPFEELLSALPDSKIYSISFWVNVEAAKRHFQTNQSILPYLRKGSRAVMLRIKQDSRSLLTFRRCEDDRIGPDALLFYVVEENLDVTGDYHPKVGFPLDQFEVSFDAGGSWASIKTILDEKTKGWLGSRLASWFLRYTR